MIRIREAILVEGRYDINTLKQVVDTVVLETGGFLSLIHIYGYETLGESAKVLAIVNEGEPSGAAAKGEKITAVLDHTPISA